MSDVVMPRLSDSMEEGTILKWLKASGDEVARGDALVEIETDKANMTYEADASGVLEIVAEEGATLPIGEPIARIGSGASAPADGAPAAAPAGPAEQPPAPEPPAPSPSMPAVGDGKGNGRIKASPVARRLARQLGVDLASLAGSGPGGRIVKADVEARAAGGAPAAVAEVPAAAPAPPAAPAVPQAPAEVPGPVVSGEGGSGKGAAQTVQLSRLQQTVARRMAEAKATVPDFHISTEVAMEAAVTLRDQLKALATDENPAPSYNDMVVKAAAVALREQPRANGAYKDGAFELYERVNVGVAVAAQDALLVPTVFDADRKSLGEIARESRALAARVRAGAITPPELSGGTFTVSNLGMFGVTEFTAIINAGQAGILAVGALRDEPVVRDGQIVPGKRMTLTLACDHRILYGADAAVFLARVRALLEAPIALAL